MWSSWTSVFGLLSGEVQSHVPGSSSAQVNTTLESNSNLDVNMMDSGFSPADDDSPVHIPWIHRRWRGPPRQPSRLGVSLGQRSRDLPRDSPRPLPRVSRNFH